MDAEVRILHYEPVATIAPTKRGLKVYDMDHKSYQYAVATIAPTKRGLKAHFLISHYYSHFQVATIAPTKRGLKVVTSLDPSFIGL